MAKQNQEIWILVVLVIIFLIVRLGPFAVESPPGIGVSPQTQTLVNNYYYDEAVSNYDFDCEVNPLVLRADSLTNPTWVVRPRSGSLVGFTYNSIAKSPNLGTQIPSTNFYENGNNIYLFKETLDEPNGFCLECRSSAGSCLNTNILVSQCNSITCGTVYNYCWNEQLIPIDYYYKFSLDDSGVSQSNKLATPVSGTYEVWENENAGVYIKSSKYACRNGKVVLQSCNHWLDDFTIQQTCETNQQCKYFYPYQTINLPGGASNKPAVKCGDDTQKWVSNKQLCNKTFTSFYQTTTLGDNIAEILCPIDTGGKCYQESSSIAYCLDCSGTITRCKPGTDNIAQECGSNGKWIEDDCGFSECEYNSGKDIYECKPISPQFVNLTYTVTTESYEQTNVGDIVFLVKVQDGFKPVYDLDITNLHIIASLSRGDVLSNEVDYSGDGIYKVSSKVVGKGDYFGRIAFNYGGIDYESPEIIIKVVTAEVSVGTSEIPPSAYVGDAKSLIFTFASTTGAPLDPDSISIEISLPTGWEDEIKTKDDLTRIYEGRYELVYTFEQVEKYSFDITASKAGFATKTAKATVAVTGQGDIPLPITWIIYGVVGIMIVFLLIGRGRQAPK